MRKEEAVREEAGVSNERRMDWMNGIESLSSVSWAKGMGDVSARVRRDSHSVVAE